MNALTESNVSRIRTLAAELDQLGQSALVKAIEAGQLLAEAKQALPHGGWLPWLKANFTFTDRTARRWMKVAEDHAAGRISDTVSDMSLSEAYQLTTTPRPEPEVVDPEMAQDEGQDEETQEPEPLVVDGIKAAPLPPLTDDEIDIEAACRMREMRSAASDRTKARLEEFRAATESDDDPESESDDLPEWVEHIEWIIFLIVHKKLTCKQIRQVGEHIRYTYSAKTQT